MRPVRVDSLDTCFGSQKPMPTGDVAQLNDMNLFENSSDQEDPAQILIVDDNFFNLEVLELLIYGLEANIEVVRAFSGKECLDHVERGTKRFSHIILDINMPEMNGCEVAHWIREHFLEKMEPTPYLISCSAQVNLSVIEGYHEGLFDCNLTKPVSDLELRTALF